MKAFGVNAMYFAVCLFAYVLACLTIYSYMKKASPENLQQQPEGTGKAMAFKRLAKWEIMTRKQLKREIPLWARFLFKVWLIMHIFILFGTTSLLMIMLHAIQGITIIPGNAITYATGIGAIAGFGAGAFLVAIFLTEIYSSTTNRGMIRQIGRLYKYRPFLEYSDSVNRIICGVLFLIGLPIMMLSLRACTYYTANGIVFQGSFVTESVSYNQIDNAEVYVEQHDEHGFSLNYIIYYRRNGHLEQRLIYDNYTFSIDLKEVDRLLVSNGVAVQRTPIGSKEAAAIIADKKMDWWIELAFGLCGVAGF